MKGSALNHDFRKFGAGCFLQAKWERQDNVWDGCCSGGWAGRYPENPKILPILIQTRGEMIVAQ